MTLAEQIRAEQWRVRLVWAAMMAALLLLGGRLWRMQVLNTSTYASSLDRQSMRRVRLPAGRGRILDRNGVCLADNRPSYCLGIYVEELREPGRQSRTVDRVDEILNRLEGVLGLPREATREDIAVHVRRRLPLPFLAWKDLPESAVARWAESRERLPGVDICVEPVRVYPSGSLACHVLGYVGRADLEARAGDPSYHYYLPEMEGKRGVEEVFNGRLAGVAGGRLIRVDASGFRYEETSEREPRAGEDVRLALDVRIQRIAERVLAGGRGALVVLDCRNGDVLAMASRPAFDGNRLGSGLSAGEWRQLSSGSEGVFVNRAVSGAYPPGSTFKPVVALAAIESGQARESTVFDCPGYFQLGSVSFRCWLRTGHGPVALRKAIEQSCNAYFCQLGLACGHERIARMAVALGLGRRTGIDLDAEAAGLVPDRAWKQAAFHDGWRPGDTCNLSIGQGALLATPLQMAALVAAIANGGRVHRPRILLSGDPSPEPASRLDVSERALRVVRGGMRDVVEAEVGTGRRAKIALAEMAGKTGTAEYGPRAARKHYAWMTVFAPFERPRYAAAIVVEEAESGGATTAPLVRELMEGIFAMEAGLEPASAPEPQEEGSST